MIRAIVLCLMASPSVSAPICGNRDDLAAKLATDYAEAPVQRGMSMGSMVEIFASPSGTWTLVVTQPDGVTCLVAAGTDWQAVPAQGEL